METKTTTTKALENSNSQVITVFLPGDNLDDELQKIISDCKSNYIKNIDETKEIEVNVISAGIIFTKDIRNKILDVFSKNNIKASIFGFDDNDENNITKANTTTSLPLFIAKEYEDAQIPVKNHEEDAGWDVYAYSDTLIPAHGYGRVPTGIRIMVGKGYRWHFASRSGLGYKKLIQAYDGSIMDSYFMGDTTSLVFNYSDEDYVIKKGDRFCQIIVTQVPDFNIKEVSIKDLEILSQNKRGDKKWGSSGK